MGLLSVRGEKAFFCLVVARLCVGTPSATSLRDIAAPFVYPGEAPRPCHLAS